MLICDDSEDPERDDVLNNLQQFSHVDDRTLQFVEVNLSACTSVKFIVILLTAKTIFTSPFVTSSRVMHKEYDTSTLFCTKEGVAI